MSSEHIPVTFPPPTPPLITTKIFLFWSSPSFSRASAFGMCRENFGATGIPVGLTVSSGIPAATRSFVSASWGVKKQSSRQSSKNGTIV